MNIVYNQDYAQGIKNYPDGYFDVAICDIPYGIDVCNMSFVNASKDYVTQNNGTKLAVKKEKTVLADWDKTAPTQEYIDTIKSKSKDQIIFGVEYVDWQGLGNGRLKWNKCVPDGMSFKPYELAYCSFEEELVEFDLLWSGMRQAKSLAEPTIQQGNKKLNEKRIHPCHKPVLLYEKLILDYNLQGKRILDTHIGGGSIRIAADKFGCELVGFEIDPIMWAKQEKRYTLYKKQLKLF